MASSALSGLFKVMAELAFGALQHERLQVSALPLLIGYVPTVIANPRRKVVGGHKSLITFQQIAGKGNYVQPIETLESGLLQPEIEVEAIYVGCDAYHL